MKARETDWENFPRENSYITSQSNRITRTAIRWVCTRKTHPNAPSISICIKCTLALKRTKLKLTMENILAEGEHAFMCNAIQLVIKRIHFIVHGPCVYREHSTRAYEQILVSKSQNQNNVQHHKTNTDIVISTLAPNIWGCLVNYFKPNTQGKIATSP